MTQRSRRFGVLGGVVVLGLFLAMCAPAGVEMIGDAMVDAGSALRDGASSDAAAQDMPCARWEYSEWNPTDSVACETSTAYPNACPVPEGWEPFAVIDYNSIPIRRCAD